MCVCVCVYVYVSLLTNGDRSSVCVCVCMYPHDSASSRAYFFPLSNDKEFDPGCIVDALVCMYGLYETDYLCLLRSSPIPAFFWNFFSCIPMLSVWKWAMVWCDDHCCQGWRIHNPGITFHFSFAKLTSHRGRRARGGGFLCSQGKGRGGMVGWRSVVEGKRKEVYLFHFRSTTTAHLLTRLKHPNSKVQVNTTFSMISNVKWLAVNITSKTWGLICSLFHKLWILLCRRVQNRFPFAYCQSWRRCEHPTTDWTMH